MHPVVMLAGVGAAAYAALTASQRKLPPGQNPFDVFPPGVDVNGLIGVDVVTTSSRRKYKVTTFPHADGRVYYVAEKKGDVDWLSYFLDPMTNARTLWAANADKVEDVEAMKRDFNLGASV